MNMYYAFTSFSEPHTLPSTSENLCIEIISRFYIFLVNNILYHIYVTSENLKSTPLHFFQRQCSFYLKDLGKRYMFWVTSLRLILKRHSQDYFFAKHMLLQERLFTIL